jgi:hypothetical protein
MSQSIVDAFIVGIGKAVLLFILLSPVLIYRYFKRKKDRANGIDPDEIEKRKQTIKDKKDHDKYFKDQNY